MKKIWISVLAVLLVTPSFALNAPDEPEEIWTSPQMVIDLGVMTVLAEAGGFTEEEFPSEERTDFAEDARTFLEHPQKFRLNEISALMLDLWLLEESQFRWGVRDNPMLRMELLKGVMEEEYVKEANKEITEKSDWYHKAIEKIAPEMQEEEVKAQKRKIILEKLEELRHPVAELRPVERKLP